MRSCIVSSFWVLGLGLLFGVGAGSLRAQDLERQLCDEMDPSNFCPGANCRCVDERLEILFDEALTDPVLEYSLFEEGLRVEGTVLIETVQPELVAWAYAIEHDGVDLDLDPDSLTLEGTTAGAVFNGGFEANVLAFGPEGSGRVGFASAIVLSLMMPDTALPVGRNSVLRVAYTLKRDVGAAGTRLRVVDEELSPVNSPPAQVDFTIGTQSTAPRIVQDGLIRKCADEENLRRRYCESVPEGECPANDDCCTENNLEIVFDEALTQNVFDAQGLSSGDEIPSLVVMDTVGMVMQGWSFGVKHEPEFLSVVDGSLTIAGTDAGDVADNPFEAFEIVSTEQVDGSVLHGYIAAVVVSLTNLEIALPVQRNSVLRATYRLESDPGDCGTLIQIVNEKLAPTNSPLTRINLTDDGKVRHPNFLTDGLVHGRRAPSIAAIRGDCNGDGKFGNEVVSDALFQLRWSFLGLEEPPCAAACDANGDGFAAGDVSDAVYMLMFGLGGGPPPPSPFPDCGEFDSAADLALGCLASSMGCE